MIIKISRPDYFGKPKATDIESKLDVSYILEKPFRGYCKGLKDISLFVPHVTTGRGGHGEPDWFDIKVTVINPQTLETFDVELEEGLDIEIYQIASR